jgi:PKD repeat protein
MKEALGIIAVLSIGVGAYFLSKKNKENVESKNEESIQDISNEDKVIVEQPTAIEDPIQDVVQTSKLNLTSIDIFGVTGNTDINETVKFYANVTSGEGIISYDWDFGDGKVSRGTDRQFESHEYKTHGQFTISLTVSNNFGEYMTKSKTINVIPNPVKESDLSIQILRHVNSAVIRITNNHVTNVSGLYDLKLKGSTQKSFSGSVFVQALDYSDITISQLVSGTTGFEFQLRTNGLILNKVEDLFIETTYIETPSEEDLGYCVIDQEIRDIVTQLNNTLIAPEWFMKYDVDYIQTCQITKESFLGTFNDMLSKGTIRARI